MDNQNSSAYRIRCERFVQAAHSEGMDAVLVKSLPNIRYFSGYTGDSGMLLIAKDVRILFTDFRYMEQATNQAKDFSIVEFKRGNEYEFTKKSVKELGVATLGYEEAFVSVAEFARMEKELCVKFAPVDKLASKLRRVKDESEIDATRRAAQLSDRAFTHLLGFIKPGMSEIDIALEIEFFVRKNGAKTVSFSPIVAAGPNGALPHAEPSARKIQSGDLLTLDFGSLVDGYCSDMTRTVGIGNVASELKNIYTICLRAQLAALAGVRAGIRAADVDAVARDLISQAGFGPNFGHGLGHGTGIQIHEAPTLRPDSLDVLEQNNIVTVEPGIYVTGLGGVRIEDLCVVKDGGFVLLSESPKELIIL